MTDAIVVGAGLSGLVAAAEIAAARRHVTVLDQEPAQSLGGQAHWSLGGLFLVDSPEQRRVGIRDSLERAREDWLGAAGFDRAEDHWPRQWAEAYLRFAAGEKRSWLHAMGMRWFPIVGWAERGRNSVPRFHVTWGTGPAVLAPFLARTRQTERDGRLEFRFRHRVDALIVEGGKIVGVRGTQLAASQVDRGVKSSRDRVGDFELRAPAVVIATGGIGGNHEFVRRHWPAAMGSGPVSMVCGVPESTDGRALGVVADAGGRVINEDRMWHYTEGVRNWNPVWPNHGIRILPGPSSLWLDANGRRLPAPLFPGFDTLETLRHILTTGSDYSWFVLNQHIIRKEFALSGSEQNPDLTGKNIRLVLGRAVGKRAMAPVEQFKERGADFVVRDSLPALVDGMNAIPGSRPLDFKAVEHVVRSYDDQVTAPNATDSQVLAIRAARKGYFGDRLVRVARPRPILDPGAGPLIAVKLHVLTRKSLGGCETDLQARVLGSEGAPVIGLYAAGEAAGFGGGGVHGYRALEGTFLGGCLFSGRVAGRAVVSLLEGRESTSF
jgi:predicted oxidoreductase